MLAACAADELLPQSPDLPADVFTACLTSPMKMALRWFCLHSPLRHEAGLDPALADSIPGQQSNRKTPLGELNWIFTAITDTIAWNVLPRPLFQRLFRQDLLVASLFRNYLLAERIMRACGCTPQTSPRLPATHGHPMWHAWDMAVEACMLQLPALLMAEAAGQTAEFSPSPFFTDQLTAFEVWLEQGSERKAPPEQLPIVLQVLLSQSHRLRALVLLGRFLDKGAWAVDLALSVGIFPYVLKLLQTTAADLRNILVFIWTKIMAQDLTCQADLVKDSGYTYFIRFLDAKEVDGKERALAAFVLACICDNHPKGQAACGSGGMLAVCLSNLASAAAAAAEPSELQLLIWLLIAMGKLWENNPPLQAEAINEGVPDKLGLLLQSPFPEVRAATVFALSALVWLNPATGDGTPIAEDPIMDTRQVSERAIVAQILPAAADASDIVRMEATAALARVAAAHSQFFRGALSAAVRLLRTSQTPAVSTSVGSAGAAEGAAGGDHGSLPGSLRGLSQLDRRFSGSLNSSQAVPPRPTAAGIAAAAAAAAAMGMSATPSAYSIMGGAFSAGMTPTSWGGKLGRTSQSNAASSAAGRLHDLAGVAVVSQHAEGSASVPLFTPRPPPFASVASTSGAGSGGGSAEGASPSGVFATADAARIGGGLYNHIMEALLGHWSDPSPRVAETGRRAVQALGMDRALNLAATSHGQAAAAGGRAGSVDGATAREEAAALAASLAGNGDETIRGGARSWVQRVTSWVAPDSSPGRPGKPAGGMMASPSSPLEDPRALAADERGGSMRGGGERGGSVRGASALSSSFTTRRMSGQEGSLRGESSRGGSYRGSHGERRTSAGAAALLAGIVEPAVAPPPEVKLPSSRTFGDGVGRMSRPLLAPAHAGLEGLEGMTHELPFHAPWARAPADEERAARRGAAASRAAATASGPALKLSEHLGWLNTDAMSNNALVFHPLEPLLAAADNTGTVRVWKYTDGSNVVAKFRAGGVSRQVAAMHLVNPLDDALLLVGTADGAVRVWRDFTAADGRRPALAAAWRALPGVLPTRAQPRSPAAFSFQQEAGCLFVAGDGAGGGAGAGLHVWDLAREMCADVVPLSTLALDAHITSLSAAAGALLLAGASDGRLLSFDLRTPAKLISSCRIHTSAVRGVLLQTGGHPNSVVTGGAGGELVWSDLRNLLEAVAVVEAHRGGLTALAGHPVAPVVASGAAERCIKLFDLSGRAISMVKYQNSFLYGHRIGAVRTLAFHPNQPVLGAGAADAIASVYGAERPERMGW